MGSEIPVPWSINEEGVSASDQEKADEILEGEFSFL